MSQVDIYLFPCVNQPQCPEAEQQVEDMVSYLASNGIYSQPVCCRGSFSLWNATKQQ